MQHKPFACRAIKGIANYGTIEPILVGCMDTQLMRAPCNGFKADNCTLTAITFNRANDFIACYCKFSVEIIDLLTWTVIIIGSKRKLYYTLAFLRHAVKDCRVLFLYGEKDIFSIPPKSRKLFAACASEDKKLVWFEKGGHSHLRINNTEKDDKSIIEFFER